MKLPTITLCLLTFFVQGGYGEKLTTEELVNKIENREIELEALKKKLADKQHSNAAMQLGFGPILEVWLLENGELNQNLDSLSIGAIVDDSVLFNYGSFQKDDFLGSYYKQPIGIRWSGLLEIKETGEYKIIHEIDVGKTERGRGWHYDILSSLKLEDGQVLENSAKDINGADGGFFPKSSTVQLKKGKYKFELWLAAIWTQHSGWGNNYQLEPKNIGVNVRLRNKNMRIPMKITKNELFHISE